VPKQRSEELDDGPAHAGGIKDAPRRTKIGTDRRMRLDMPSSMRPIITIVGREVVKVRKVSAPRPKQKAIGTPMARKNATKPTRKMRMLI
jgi:hypothetical protein